MIKTSKRRAVITMMLALTLASVMLVPSLVSGRDDPKRAKSHLYARGKGLVIYGYNWYPPYPGEPFFIGSDEAQPPFLGMLGTPEWSAKLDESEINFMAESKVLVEAPVRADPPYPLPMDLTKYWMMEMTGTGSMTATWTHDEQVYSFNIEIEDQGSNILGVWTGPPGTVDWGFYAAGGPHPRMLPFLSYAFSGEMNGEQIQGYVTVSAWPDIMMVNLWIDNGGEGTFVNFVWVNPESFTTHYWLAYWLGEEIGLPEFGYGEDEDPLATWVPPADKFKVLVNME